MLACFSLEWLKALFIWAIIIVVVLLILDLLVPYVLGKLATARSGGLAATVSEALGIIATALRYVFWGGVAILVVVVCFDLISCVISHSGSLSLPHPPR